MTLLRAENDPWLVAILVGVILACWIALIVLGYLNERDQRRAEREQLLRRILRRENLT